VNDVPIKALTKLLSTLNKQFFYLPYTACLSNINATLSQVVEMYDSMVLNPEC